MKRGISVTAAVVAAVAVWVVLALPPARHILDAGADDGTVPGVLHVHTNRSDGRSAPDEIAAAAARAGLRFVAFTDHGDATAKPDPPAYRHGVLCLDGVEISTIGGHYIALGLQPAPYPLGGEARDVIEDVRRLGGLGIAAHPDSPKQDLRWREWNEPFDAIELINLDSGWRTRVGEPGWRPKLAVLEALATYPFRAGETIAALVGESSVAFARWESMTARRRVVALSGVDAHAKLALRDVDPGDNRYSLPLPGYESSFATLTLRAKTRRPLTGDAALDAELILEAIAQGHVYTAFRALAEPPVFDFTATNARGTAQVGDELKAAGPVTLRIRSNAPPSFTTTVWRDGQVLSADHHEPEFTIAAPADPAVYRVEIRATDRDRTPVWILSNPIYVRGSAPTVAARIRPRASVSKPLFDPKDVSAWKTETDATSVAALDRVQGATGPEIRFRFGLATGPPSQQFAALSVATGGGLAEFDRLSFTIRGERPMRVSVQLRAAVSPSEDERWQRSVYVDPTAREQTIFLDDVSPIGATRTYRPPLAAVHSIVFAVDTTNTRPGTSGRVWVSEVRLQK